MFIECYRPRAVALATSAARENAAPSTNLQPTRLSRSCWPTHGHADSRRVPIVPAFSNAASHSPATDYYEYYSITAIEEQRCWLDVTGPCSQTRQSVGKARQPLSAWELPVLVEPMYKWQRKAQPKPIERSHFLPILGFIYRNRFATASQIRRRFPNWLPSARTARRHLAEMEANGDLSVAQTRSTSPLFPKVFFVTNRGTRKIARSLRENQKPGILTGRDRWRPEGFSADHILHEILLTEFLLELWRTVASRTDLELLSVQRRSLERHPAFNVTLKARPQRLRPDAMALYRRSDGMLCVFIELDTGTMTRRQLEAKYARYQAWSVSPGANRYLVELYSRFGAASPRPNFRILNVICPRPHCDHYRRLAELVAAAGGFPAIAQKSWFTTSLDLQLATAATPLEGAIWIRGRDMPNICKKGNSRCGVAIIDVRRHLAACELKPLFANASALH